MNMLPRRGRPDYCEFLSCLKRPTHKSDNDNWYCDGHRIKPLPASKPFHNDAAWVVQEAEAIVANARLGLGDNDE